MASSQQAACVVDYRVSFIRYLILTYDLDLRSHLSPKVCLCPYLSTFVHQSHSFQSLLSPMSRSVPCLFFCEYCWQHLHHLWSLIRVKCVQL